MAAAERNDQPIARAQDASHPLRRAILHFVGAALIILIVAPFFAASAKSLAGLTGLSTTFVGTWLVGISTSLPELVTSIAAVRLKAYDLAVGNLFGSNAFNMLMFLPLDLAQSKAPILSVVSAVHALSALTAIVLMGIALAAIVYRATGRLRLIEPSGWLMLLAYGIGLGLLLTQTRGR
jgi:cation:H+ antiporter